MKKLCAMLTAVLIALCAAALPALADEGAGSVDLTGHIVILHTGNVCGNADENLGYRSAAEAKRKLEGAGATVFLLDSGNALTGRPLASVSRGEAIVKLMNAAAYDAMAAAHGEFRLGTERLKELAGIAQFPVLSANSFAADGSKPLENSVILEKGNVRIGVFALTEGVAAEDATFTDPVGTAKEQAAALAAQKCTLIVALADFGGEQAGSVSAEEIARQVPEINILLDGSRLLEEGMWLGNTLISAAGRGLENIGCIDIAPDGLTAATLLTEENFARSEPDAEIEGLLASLRAEQSAQMGKIVVRSSVDLNGAAEDVQGRETNLGNLAADAVCSRTGADAAVISAGSIADSLPAGNITRQQLAAAFPSGDSVVVREMTGRQLIDFLEECVRLSPAPNGLFPQVSGLSFRYDTAQPAGSRVFEVKIAGESVEPEKTYTLALDAAYQIAGAPVLDKPGSVEELMTEYLGSFEAEIAPETEERIVVGSEPEL